MSIKKLKGYYPTGETWLPIKVDENGKVVVTGISTGGGAENRVTDTVTITNTTTETTVYSYTVPANKLSTNKMLRLTLVGDYLNNSGANRSLRLRIYLGDTLIFDDSGSVVSPYPDLRAWRLTLNLSNLGAVDSQFLSGFFNVSSASEALVGTGDFAGTVDDCTLTFCGSASEDTTADKLFKVTLTFSAANENLTLKCYYALLELI